MLGSPGTRARPMPAITSRIEGATFSRRARIATATRTDSSSSKSCTVAVMDEFPRGDHPGPARYGQDLSALTAIEPKSKMPGEAPGIPPKGDEVCTQAVVTLRI